MFKLYQHKGLLIGIAVSAVLLFLFLRQTDFGEMWQALKEAKYVFLIPALLVRLFGVYLRSVRWQYFLKPFGSFSSLRLFPLVVIGFLVNSILPGRLGIVARAYMLGEEEKISKMAVGGTMVAEQVFDGVTLIIFALCIAMFVPLVGLVQGAVYIAAALFSVALVFCLILAFSQRFARMMINMVLVIVPEKWHRKAEEWLQRLVDGLQFMRSPHRLAVSFFLSALVWLCEAAMFYMAGLAFDLQQPFHVMVLVTAVASLSWAFMFVAPAGVGAFEYACSVTLMQFVPVIFTSEEYTAMVAAFVVVLHALIILPMVVLGFVFLWRENLSLAKVAGRRQRPTKDNGETSRR